MSKQDMSLRQNFISVDNNVARNSYGTFFKVGDTVGHEGAEDQAVIERFEIDNDTQEVKAHTNRGHGHIDFMYHP